VWEERKEQGKNGRKGDKTVESGRRGEKRRG